MTNNITSNTTVVIADASPEFADYLEETLVSNKYNVLTKAHKKQQLLEVLLEMQPDIVIVDYNLSKDMETDSTLALHRKFPRQKILLLSYFVNLQIFEYCIEHGINGFLLKSCTPKELFDAIELVIQDGFYLPMENEKNVSQTPPQLNTAARKMKLTLQEMQIIKYIVEKKTSEEIAKLLFVNAESIDLYKEAISNKTGHPIDEAFIPFATEFLL